MKKLVSILLATMLVVSCLAGLAFAAEAEAKWTDGTTTVEGTYAEMAKQAANRGGTLTLLQDVTYTGDAAALFNSKVSLTIDLNGHTMTTSKGAININKGANGVTAMVGSGPPMCRSYSCASRARPASWPLSPLCSLCAKNSWGIFHLLG